MEGDELMAQNVGDIVKEALLVVEDVTVKDSEDIEKGEVIYNDGAGFLARPNTAFEETSYIALEAHDYSEVSNHVIRAALSGCITVQKTSASAIKEGQKVMISSTAGEVTVFAKGDAPTGGVSTYYTSTIETGVQTALDNNLGLIVGTCAKDAGQAAVKVDVWVGRK